VSASSNLNLVRAIYAAWERGDFSSSEWAHPEIEWVAADGVQPGTRTGLAGMAQSFREFGSAWKEYRVEVDEYRELDDERVFVLVRRTGRGKISGLDMEQIQTGGAHLFYFREGKVTKLVVYADRDRALADLGLAPEGNAA
jgi:ketosteroid isomerase-like protein